MEKSCRLRLPSGGGIGIEGIDQSRNFYWVDDNTDEASVAAYASRQASVHCRIGSLEDVSEGKRQPTQPATT